MEHQQEILSKNGKTIIKKCSCGSYYLSYKSATVHLSEVGLLRVMDVAYTHNSKIEKDGLSRPFNVNLGAVVLLVSANDFEDFFKTMDEATNIKTKINQLLNN